jgi:large-conductance mechanosensitive channel
MSLLAGFKKFLLRGNVVDLANRRGVTTRYPGELVRS